jgi:MFS family permease
LASSLTTAFTYLLPLGGLFGIPFVGYLLDKRSIRDAILVLAVFGVIFGALGVTSAATPQIISIATLTILRPLMYTAVSDFSAK